MSSSNVPFSLHGCYERIRRLLRLGNYDAVVITSKKTDTAEPVTPELEAAFEKAAAQVSTLANLSTGDRLGLYALYKQVTVGDAPQTGPNSVMDPTGRHKWSAWSKLAGMSRAAAMEEYIDKLARIETGETSDASEADDLELDAIDAMMGGMQGPPKMSSLAGDGPAEEDADTIPLHAAAKQGDVSQCMALVDAGGDVDALDEDRHTALHWACDSGHVKVVQLLLENNANPNVQNIDGSAPLHMACACEHEDIVRVLLACGADPNLRDDDGCAAAELIDKMGLS